MKNEIEDIVEQIKYTDSQKSVTPSNAYSQDFTDSSSDKNLQSSGKETYVIDHVDNESEKIYPLHSDESILNLSSKDFAESDDERKPKHNRRNHSEAVFVENTFTQTSKSLFQLRNEVSIQNTVELQHLETQTSFDAITKRIDVNNTQNLQENQHVSNNEKQMHVRESDETKLKMLYSNSFDDNSSVLKDSEIDCESKSNDNMDRDGNFITLKNYDSKDVSSEYYNYSPDESSDEESWSVNSDIEEDSLMQNGIDAMKQDYSSDIDSGTLESVENDVTGLYQTIASVPRAQTNTYPDSAICDVSVLTTVTEETNTNNSVLHESQIFYSNNIQSLKDPHRAARSKFRIQALFNNGNTNENDGNNLKLPPIYTNSSSPIVNPLFCVNNQQMQPHKHPHTIKEHQVISDRYEYGYKNLASGESPLVYTNHDANNNSVQVQLPPITFNVFSNQYNKIETLFSKTEQRNQEMRCEEINIRDKIQDLKVSNTKTKPEIKKRSKSPSECPIGEPKVCEVAEKGCDALCTDIMRRLQSSTWQEVAETLAYLPKSLESFWPIMSEIRTADLLRQIVSLIQLPRTQVAQAACEATGHLLKHTNFTKKPEFNEAVSVLLAKTNSYNRAVRRAANLALDELVCGLHYTRCVDAICVAGVEHKSPLVRCAASRLLIVCCAMAEGGRRLLRCRPPSAAAARRHVLQAMAVLLHDKNLETRKYAERLYAILRPLPNFEAYFLTDVDAKLATEHMKKYDHILKLNAKNTR
ncbi:uncharacterized protein LOC121725235 [Aricia agestis]|uniref:uncharacterized protein LOC121725235 n=1 Tax=Aricia agestis TaxID=91739 RepID=UPI001C20C129|nr:uncharacterized protein LOC121725235 [Aricia agestis]